MGEQQINYKLEKNKDVDEKLFDHDYWHLTASEDLTNFNIP
jgi:hypothetical protein